jgi:hypothetical protein
MKCTPSLVQRVTIYRSTFRNISACEKPRPLLVSTSGMAARRSRFVRSWLVESLPRSSPSSHLVEPIGVLGGRGRIWRKINQTFQFLDAAGNRAGEENGRGVPVATKGPLSGPGSGWRRADLLVPRATSSLQPTFSLLSGLNVQRL